MNDPDQTRRHAVASLLRLIDHRIQGHGVNPPFELADIAVDAIATHADVLAIHKGRPAAKVDTAHHFPDAG